MPVDSTMKKGLPPARPTIAAAWPASSRAPPACRTSSAASPSAKGSRRTPTWFTAPVPQAGRSSNSSARAVTSTSTRPGLCRPRAAIRSIRSSIAGRSACASSKSRVTGRSLARPSSSARNPDRTSCTNADSSGRGPDSPTRASSRSNVRSPSMQTRSISSRNRSAATSVGSSSPTPATSRTMAAAGANVALSAPRWLRPTRTVPSGSSPARNSAASRDFPIPGSPTSVNRSGREVVMTRENACLSIASSSDLPTKGIVRRTERVLSPSTLKAASGSAKPLASTRRSSPKDTSSSASARVVRPTRISPGCAAACSRAAVLTTDPVTRSWSSGPVPVAASPDPMPTRICSGSGRLSSSQRRSTRSRIASPARTARRASSSCTRGSPNTAITASPMNFSGRPRSATSSSTVTS